MTREDAYELLDFIQKRIFGWTIVIGCNNPSGRMDSRYKSVKQADRLFRDAFMPQTEFPECIAAFERDEDPVLQWPVEFQEFVRFCLWHRVPREINEPLSEEKFDHRPNPPRVWPEFLHQYGKTATLDEMPALPGPSERMLKLEADRREAVTVTQRSGGDTVGKA
ncbi:MAG: hypothetical protein ACK4P4_09150 [Allorhizobium sp.]